jgi:hypothetical protein
MTMSSKRSALMILWISVAACEASTALQPLAPTPVALACASPDRLAARTYPTKLFTQWQNEHHAR